MLLRSNESHRYSSAHKRFFKPAIERFFEVELSRIFGPGLINDIADRLIEIFNDNNRNITTIKPGQILWNTVSKSTRADAPNMKLVPVVLTIVANEDISNLVNKTKMYEHRQNVVARITKEAFEQGGLLSMRDIGLFLTITPTDISAARIDYEIKHNLTLPHTGNLHDMGTTLTHKHQIVYKYVVDKKDVKIIAKETNHSIKAVERYLYDFNRVKTLYLDGKSIEYIKTVTKMPKHVTIQYIEMINEFVKEPIK